MHFKRNSSDNCCNAVPNTKAETNKKQQRRRRWRRRQRRHCHTVTMILNVESHITTKSKMIEHKIHTCCTYCDAKCTRITKYHKIKTKIFSTTRMIYKVTQRWEKERAWEKESATKNHLNGIKCIFSYCGFALNFIWKSMIAHIVWHIS